MVNEKKQNTSPFRVKKVGDKYEYDFVSYDEWGRMTVKMRAVIYEEELLTIRENIREVMG